MPETAELDFKNLADLAGVLTAAGIRSADTDPANVQAPGVWIRFDGVELDNLAGVTILATLHLIVPKSTFTTVQTQLADLFNQVVPALAAIGEQPTGTTRPTAVALPGNAANPLPALAVPLELLTTKEG